MRAIAREREQRFQSVSELALALEPFANGAAFHPTAVHPKTMKPRKQSWTGRLSLRLVLALTALLMPCGLGLGWHWIRSPAVSRSAEAAPIEHEFLVRPRASSDHAAASALPIPKEPPSQLAPEAAPHAPRAAKARSPRARATRPAEASPSAKPAAPWDERISIPLPTRGTPPMDTGSAAGRLTAGDL